jgi:ParB-like partition proteins
VAKKVLGKGLMALLDEDIKEEVLVKRRPKERFSDLQKRIEEIPIEKIKPDPFQPRDDFSGLQELIDSIREKGIIQPLLLRRKEDFYSIIAGERRYRAAKELKYKTVPAIVIDADEQSSLELAIIENVQRKDLSPVEEARAYQKLIERFNLTHEDISKKVGKDRATITNLLRILTLPEEVIKDVSRGTISAGHAKVLAGLKDKEEILKWRRKILKEDLSVRRLESLISKEKKVQRPKSSYKVDIFLKDFESFLEEFFSTKVRIKGTNRKGKIIIEYYNLDDLERMGIL